MTDKVALAIRQANSFSNANRSNVQHNQTTGNSSAYCQLIRAANKQKRVEWARNYLNEVKDGFEDVIWSGESSIQLEAHKRFCYQKKGCPPRVNQGT